MFTPKTFVDEVNLSRVSPASAGFRLAGVFEILTSSFRLARALWAPYLVLLFRLARTLWGSRLVQSLRPAGTLLGSRLVPSLSD